MNLGIAGKRALVTGGGRGLGRAIAVSLAREGVRVAVCSRTPADVEAVVGELTTHGSHHVGRALDLTSDGAPGELAAAVQHEFDGVDIIVHNLGGTLDINDPFCSIDEWRRVWRFNLEVAVELNLLLVPQMRERRWGRIVHVSSISAMENQGPIPYCSIKAALTAYSRSLGRFLSPDGIVVTAVLPGAVFTAGGYWDVASRERPDHVRKYLDERMAIRRFGVPEEISEVVTFLCSQQASFCIGSVVPIDGGQGRTFFG